MSKKKKKVVVKPIVDLKDQSVSSSKVSYSKFNPNVELTFSKQNFKWMAIGISLIVVGMLLMLGGFNENPNIWDESQIYGFQRTVLAPAVILSGLAVNIYALFK